LERCSAYLRFKTMSKQKWLFTDWGFGMSHFKIYDSYDSFNLITSRDIRKGNHIQWFNIDNIKREIKEWSKVNGVKLKGLNETLKSIEEAGFSYTDSDKEKTISQANKQNSSRDKSNPFSKEIRIIE